MAGESLGTAYISLSVDVSDYQAKIDRAKSQFAAFGTEVEQGFQKSTSAQKKAALSLLRYVELAGKGADETKLLRAAMQGVDANFLAKAAGKLNETREGIAAAERAVRNLAAAEAEAASFSIAAKVADENNKLKEQQRVVQALTMQFHALEAAEAETAALSLAAKKVDENNFLKEQQRVVAALTAQFHALEAAEAQAAQGQQFVQSLQQQANAIGKTRSELLEMKAAEMGVSAQAAPFIAKLREQEQQLLKSGIAFDKYGLSAKQTAAALRQVPAQMTDIFVSLQGGQNPLTVLLQQGGQLKDVFGGVVPAARALGGAVLGLVNPWTLAAAAVALFVVAITDAQSKQGELANSLILTGNAANTTTEELQRMARQLDDTTQASERHSTQVVAAVAASGRFTREQVEQVSRAALQMEEATGQSIQKTIANFAAIGDDPVSAIRSLNNAVGDLTGVTNFLSAEQVKQIELLQRQGDEAGAAKIMFDAYADAISQRAPQATENLSTLAGAWKKIKEQVGDATDATLGFFANLDNKNAEFQKKAQDWAKQQGGLLAMWGNVADRFIADPAKAPAAVAPGKPGVSNAQMNAYLAFQAEVKSNLSDEARQREEIIRITNQGNAAVKAGLTTQAAVDKALADSAARYKEAQDRKAKGASGARSLANAESRADLQAFKDVLLQEQTAISNSTQILQAQYAARSISAKEYYDGLRSLTEKSQAAEEKALQGQIAALRGRDVAGKDSVDTIRKIGELEAQLAKIRADSSTKLAILTIQEEEANERRIESIREYAEALADANDELEANFAFAAAAVGMGREEAMQQDRIAQAYRRREEALNDLARQLRTGQIEKPQYDEEVRLRQEATDREVQIVRDGYAAMKAAEADWMNGFKSGIADWISQTSNVAEQIRGITTHALDTASEALADFALTGKLEIKKLLADILTELVKFFAKRAVMMFVQAFLGGFGAAPTSGTNFGIPMPGSGGGNFFLNAKGNPFSKGTSLPSNTILTKPTLFKFARGGAFNGIAGEAGAEAVMPLERGPDGKLGVRASGGGSMVALKVETNVYSDGRSESKVTSEGEQAALYGEFTAHMQRVSQREIEAQMRPGGMLWRAGVTAG